MRAGCRCWRMSRPRTSTTSPTSTPRSRTCPPFADAAGGRADGPTSGGDRGYDSQPHRDRLAARGIVCDLRPSPHVPRQGLGVFRLVVERTLAWLRRFRRLAVRYERHDRVHHAFLTLG